MSVRYSPIPGCPGYRAGTDGSIWSCWRRAGKGMGWKLSQTWCRLRSDPRPKDGRARYTLRASLNRYRRTYGARLVLMAFVGPCPSGMECCHNNGKCKDDRLSNLRWDTPVANKADMLRHRTRLQGERTAGAKITEAAVRFIREKGYPLKQHAELFGITEAMVSLIIQRKAWKHVA
jgi:hypothetical protein